MKIKKKKFVFEISIEAFPHNKETVEAIYGENSFEEGKFNIQINAHEIIFKALNDLCCYRIRQKIKHLTKCECAVSYIIESDKRYYDYLCQLEKEAKYIVDSLTFSREEEIL